MPRPLALVVDDEPDIRELLAMTLDRMEIDTVLAENLDVARKRLPEQDYFLCLTDMRLPDGDGIDLVRHIQHTSPQTPVAVITAYGNIEGAVNTLKAGAFDYVSKPVDLQLLRRLVSTALRLSDTKSHTLPADKILLGDSDVMQELRATISKVARSQAPVFIQGASGTGKELVASLIHRLGPRAEHDRVAVNCGAIPSELMESEFFGHRKGSFSGANSDKMGLFQAADGGSLFLDEIAELPLAMQVKLLRVIQEKSVRPIGGLQESAVDVRIISASHKDLQQQVALNLFRQDLFYRINVITLRVPSLVERTGDIPLLADHILTQLAINHARPALSLSEEGLSALQTYPYPGNVRELENILERAFTLCEGSAITAADLRLSVQTPVPSAPHVVLPPVTCNTTISQQEKASIIAALERHKWNRTKAATELGLSLRALRYRLKKYGM